MKLVKRLISFAKKLIKLSMDPVSTKGLQREIPLLFWQEFTKYKYKKLQLEFVQAFPLTGNRTSINNPTEFFQDHLFSNLLDFWHTNSLDYEYGGYITHLDRYGHPYDDSIKYAAMQARLIYAFSAGHRLKPDRGYLQLAEHGVNFLLKYFWDNQQGGWYNSVQRDGKVKSTTKDLFHQSYVLVGLTEYYRTTQDTVVLGFITRTYQLLEKHAWDATHLGFFESCYADWSIQSHRKTVCIQIDMLRALIALSSTIDDPIYRKHTFSLADLILKHTYDQSYGCLLETFYPDWRYSPLATEDQIQIGHNLKMAWLLLSANELEPHPLYIQAATRMVEYCLNYGWDHVCGGSFQDVYRNGLKASPVKIWWPECEGLHVLIALHQLTGEPRYWKYFQALTDFVFNSFIDHEYKEWFTSCSADGTPLDANKGGIYKSAYHTVQTCVAVLQKLNDFHPREPS